MAATIKKNELCIVREIREGRIQAPEYDKRIHCLRCDFWIRGKEIGQPEEYQCDGNHGLENVNRKIED